MSTSRQHPIGGSRRVARRQPRLLRGAFVAASAALAGVLVAACGSGGSGGGSGSGAAGGGPVHIKVWAWYPDFKQVVDQFNKTHKDVQVDWVQAGVGQDEYTKLKTALKAGQGAPDVVMLEFQELPTIQLTKGLLDIGKYGANDDKKNYVPWAWNQVSDGDHVYAVPVDGGPMAMLYREDIFKKYKLKVPTTWDEYKQEAAKLHAADPKAYMTDFGSDESAAGWLQGLMWQAGSRPYTYSASKLPNIGVKMNDDGAKKVYDYWGDLVKNKLVDTASYATTDFYNGLSSGKYATYLAAGWGPGYLQSVAKKTGGLWRAAPLPQWTAGGNAQGDWGGSTFAVTSQTKNPKQATEVARELFGTSEAAWKIGIDQAYLFPLATPILNGSYFQDKKYDFFGGQQVNKIFGPAANNIGTFDWSPFQDYAYNTQTSEVGKALQGQTPWSSVADNIQQQVAGYASKQGFKVSQ
ncbi:ABC transporter substrate-binding protein [Streptomyces sp. NPDC003753]|uniref:ABC transporter substrate-binding protein n=1 Tax=unclassified Streptomyces TaxID=2593676 RepID=UPI001904503E|nr:extracellular solute-binding protein [Streptomyces sp. Y2F8-2]GHK00661.1 sugar ABC transporter substrate-binding protein [Streptomyces sp. Y2F8-2]